MKIFLNLKGFVSVESSSSNLSKNDSISYTVADDVGNYSIINLPGVRCEFI